MVVILVRLLFAKKNYFPIVVVCRSIFIPERDSQSASISEQPHPLFQLHSLVLVCRNQPGVHTRTNYEVDFVLAFVKEKFLKAISASCSGKWAMVFELAFFV